MDVQNRLIPNVPKVKTTHMSINRWVDKQVLVHPSNGLRLSNKKEQTRHATTEMNPQTKRNKRSQTQKSIYCTVHLYEILEFSAVGGFAPRGHLEISENLLGLSQVGICHLVRTGWDAAQHPTVQRSASTEKNYLTQMSKVSRLTNLG